MAGWPPPDEHLRPRVETPGSASHTGGNVLLLILGLRLLADPPNPPPSPPPGLAQFGNDLVAFMKWGGGIAGMAGLIYCAVMMMIGRRNRSQMAVDGATGVPWVGAGLAVIGSAATIVGFFLGR
jgi:hypothetical protein